jgi:hypothetical protein
MKQIYFDDWEQSGLFGLVADFEGIYTGPADYSSDVPTYPNAEMWQENKDKMAAALADDKYAIDVLFAAYTYENYSGDAFVLFRKNGALYEVNGGHCSCYGLEQQWEPEETTKEVILKRLNDGATYGILADRKNEIRAALEPA